MNPQKLLYQIILNCNSHELLSYLNNNIIDVNEEFKDGFRIFDYVLLLYDNCSTRKRHELKMFFLNKKELIVTNHNIVSLNGKFSNYDIHHQFDILKSLSGKPNIEKSILYYKMMHYCVHVAIHKGNHIIVKDIFNLPQYDMKTDCNASPFDHCLKKFLYFQTDSDINKTITIMDIIMNHHTFILTQNHVKLLHNPKYHDKIRSLIKEHISQQSSKLFVLMLAYNDDYFITNNKFFNITKHLPAELQMIIANRVYDIPCDFIIIDNIKKNLSIINNN